MNARKVSGVATASLSGCGTFLAFVRTSKRRTVNNSTSPKTCCRTVPGPLYFELLSQLAETRGRQTGYEFLDRMAQVGDVLSDLELSHASFRRACGRIIGY
jgi:hypothetical protein